MVLKGKKIITSWVALLPIKSNFHLHVNMLTSQNVGFLMNKK